MNDEKRELTAICPACDNIIEVEEDVFVGDLVSCTNPGCFWEGTVEDIDRDGNVWFEKEKEEKE